MVSGAANLPIATAEHEWDGSGASQRVRDFYTKGEDTDWAKVADAFFWHEAGADTIGAFKLGFADIVDGKLTAIPRGINAVAAAIGGARTPMKQVTETEKATIQKKVEAYQKKMESESERGDSLPGDCGQRAVTVVPESYDPKTNTQRVVFATREGAVGEYFDKKTNERFIEDLDFDGWDLSLLNAPNGAPLVRMHGMDPSTHGGRSPDSPQIGIDDVIGRTIPGTAIKGASEHSVMVRYSDAPGDADVVAKCRCGMLDISAGYIRLGPPVVTQDAKTGLPYKKYRGAQPYEISPVPRGFDRGAGFRSAEFSGDLPGGAPGGGTLNNGARKMEKTPEELAAERAEQERKDQEQRAAIEAAKVEGARAEAQRQAEIRKIVDPFVARGELDEKGVRAMLDDATVDVAAARARVIDLLAANERAAGTDTSARHTASVGRESRDTRLDAMRDALVVRTDSRAGKERAQYDQRSGEFAGYRLRDFARECLSIGGFRGAHQIMDDGELFDRALGFRSGGMQSTSDFPLLLSNVVHKNFLNVYSQETPNFEEFSIRRVIPDFKPVKELKLASFSTLDADLEGAELNYGSMDEGGETWALGTYRKGWKITRKALINDDLDAFGSAPARMASAVNRLKLNVVWGLFTANPTMADGNAVFSTAHANYTASGAAPSVTTIQVGRQALAEQTDLGGNYLNLVASHIALPPVWMTAVDQLLTSIFPVQASGVTPMAIRELQAITEPRLGASGKKQWFLISKQYPSIVVGYLAGAETPRFQSWESKEIEGMQFKIVFDFGAAVADHRGLYCNNGE